ncbi:helicase-associated domain-containing protein [Actinomyces israelii]|uniref:helicase-associated domain-containing protein n=1 Tax=Actinomyces israelii TaxID=1659 RepID=UPI00255430E8|nr:helicase-associated domain-containing protein [Actinomyces israelii]WKR22974.1 hypothetical protein AIF0345_2938 [Actinomyces israelii]
MSIGEQCGGDEKRSERSPRAPTAGGASLKDLAGHLAALPDADVIGLFTARPDLTTPPSASFTALAARAGARPSVEAALAHLDTPTLAVAEAVVALEEQDADALAAALDLEPEDVAARLERLARLALVIDSGPVTGLADAFGPHPFGLGPAAADPIALPPPLSELRAEAGKASEAALAMLRALTWGPPVGTLRVGGKAPGAAELVRRGWLACDHDTAGRTRFVMPRQVALALRGGRLTREPLRAPEPDDLEVLSADAVAAEATRHGEETVRLVGALLDEWGREGGPILRTGGVGVRALGRTAEALGVEPATAASLIEAAAATGLLGLDDDGAAWVPARTAAAWLRAELPERWAALVVAWPTSARTAWLVGRRGDDGILRPVLGADVEAAWARTLRRRVLRLLASLPVGTAVTPMWVRAALTFARPRRPVPEGAVTAVLAEAEQLGLTGGGALSSAGRLLAGSSLWDDGGAGLSGWGDDAAGAGAGAGGGLRADGPDDRESEEDRLLARLEEALAADLPDPVDMLLVQSDLTAIVPGRPVPALAAVLERCAVIESRGGALTVRFTADSVRGALDAGCSGEDIVEELAAHSPTPLPSALTVLIEDAVRRHGAVRVREAVSVLRVGDPAVAAGIVGDPQLAGLALAEVGPGVLASSVPTGRVLRELRSAGLAPVLEDASGRLLVAGEAERARRGGVRAPEPAYPGSQHSVRRRRLGKRELAALVSRLRAGEQMSTDSGVPASAATDPVHALALLRQAQASRTQLRLRLAGPDGAVQERRVRVLAVEPGRVRIADVVRQTELTVAVHRIVSVNGE